MKYLHRMPFGAMIEDGGVLFQFWAPAAKRVDLHLAEPERDLPMRRTEEGWFHLGVPNLGAGASYQFIIDTAHRVPDPASRYQPQDVHGPSEVIDAEAFDWDDEGWVGRPWREAVIYEIHIGTFTREGTYDAAAAELERLAQLGVTAVELMPLSDFSGTRNWGYDGVLPFAPDSVYGRPESLKRFIATAHRLGLMVFIDVVYNHFGPDGNYLPLYAPQFFASGETGWGDRINFGGEGSQHVRRFFLHNALYWLIEYHADGLRFDAVHAIHDESDQHFLNQLAAKIRETLPDGRHVHLILENDRNEARYLERGAAGAPVYYDAQWNDDFHHACHVLLTGENEGYYADYASAPLDHLGRALTEGFAYQGGFSAYREGNRGEPSRHLPPLAFVDFLQNHDQIGNRAFGERLTTLAPEQALAAAAAVLLLAPSPPLLFMGEDWGATAPFLFFCDFKGDLATAVREGRRREFARFPAFSSPAARERIPDPLDIGTFERSRLDRASQCRPDVVERYRSLLSLRHREIVPHLRENAPPKAAYEVAGRRLTAEWQFEDGAALRVVANLGNDHAPFDRPGPDWRHLWGPEPGAETLDPWTVIWSIRR
jgi:malto-oligosyltrehalose trehalohydrolase